MDSNHLYQDQQPGTEPDNRNQEAYPNGDAGQPGNAYQGSDAYSQGSPYQSYDAGSQGSGYPNDNAYQQPGYGQYNQNNGYNNGNYGNYGSGNYSNGNYGGGNYANGNYGGNYNSSYGSYQAPYQQSQLDLEEPVKMSEWLISMLLMLVPCLNIIMMFVWAFSKTEKKSKSNFFKAYLIVFGVLFALYLVIVIMIAAGVFGSLYF